MATQHNVQKLYRHVVEDVINNVRESFLDEGVDEQVLQELKQLWESKLQQSKAVESMNDVEQLSYKVQQPTVASSSATKRVLSVQPQTQQVGRTHTTTGSIPVFTNLAGGQLGMSQAATTATIALPPQYQQQFPPGSLITTEQGTFLIQAPITQNQVVTTGVPVQRVQAGEAQGTQRVLQLDGANDSSSEDDDDFEEDKDEEENDEEKEEEGEQGEEEEPLNSGDDVSDVDPSELFDADNVVVCQYDKISRCKNKWKFQLKDGIMNLNSKDFVFQKASGDAEW